MARKPKKGLNYFTLDVSFSDSIKLATIEAGNNVIPVLIELWQKIYGSHGYYMDFKEDHKLLFISSALTKINIDELDKIIEVFFKRGIFSRSHYQKFGILTSDSIQERFIDSCNIAKRQNTLMFSEYICCDLSQCETEKITFRSINDDYSGINNNNNEVVDDNSGTIPDNSGNFPNNSGKSTYKVESIESIDSNRKNSGINPETKKPITIPIQYSELSLELKNHSKTKEFCIKTYFIKPNQYDLFVDWFIGTKSTQSDDEIVCFKEWNQFFKEWMKFNYDKLPQQQEQKQKAKLL